MRRLVREDAPTLISPSVRGTCQEPESGLRQPHSSCSSRTSGYEGILDALEATDFEVFSFLAIVGPQAC